MILAPLSVRHGSGLRGEDRWLGDASGRACRRTEHRGVPELFTVIPPSIACAKLLGIVMPIVGREQRTLGELLGRVCAQDVQSHESLPAFTRSAMDGYAVHASDTFGASESSPAYLQLSGEVRMGVPAIEPLPPGCARKIHTGAMLPPGADAVVMIEATNLHGDDVEVLESVAPGEDVIVQGEDVARGEVVVPAGRRLRAAEVGALSAIGVTTVEVFARPRVAVLSTGDEVVPAGLQPALGQVRDVNAATIAAAIVGAGGIPVACGIAPDDEEAMFEAASLALETADALVLSAGSSVSVRDLTARVVDRLGPPGVLVHGIAIKPGKPTVLAMCAGKPVIGLPGNPASALVVAWRILAPLVRALGGETGVGEDTRGQCEVDAVLTLDVPSRPGREDYVAARLARDDDGTLHATPLFGKSNLIFTLVRADGLIVIPLDRAGERAGSTVRVIVP